MPVWEVTTILTAGFISVASPRFLTTFSICGFPPSVDHNNPKCRHSFACTHVNAFYASWLFLLGRRAMCLHSNCAQLERATSGLCVRCVRTCSTGSTRYPLILTLTCRLHLSSVSSLYTSPLIPWYSFPFQFCFNHLIKHSFQLITVICEISNWIHPVVV